MAKLDNIRYKKIIYKLLHTDKYITTESLAKILNVSRRTVRRDLKKIKNYLKEVEEIEAVLIKKPRKGIKLEIEQDKKIQLMEKLKNYHPEHAYSSTLRQTIIINNLLKDTSSKADLIADDLNISISTFYNDCKKAEEYLKKYNLKIKNDKIKGKTIIGNEINIRTVITRNILNLLSDDDKEDILYLLANKIPLKANEIQYLKQFSLQTDLQNIYKIIETIAIKNEITFNSQAILYLVIYTTISIKRINDDNYIHISCDRKNTINKKSDIITFIINQFQKRLKIKLLDNEVIGFILQICINSSLISWSNILTDPELDLQLFKTVKKLIAVYEKNINIKLTSDKKLSEELILYLRSILVRFKYNMPSFSKKFNISDIELEELRTNNPYLFELATKCKQIINFDLNININQHDIDYIAIFFLSRIEIKSRTMSALVIHDNSVPVFQLMVNRLKNRIPELKLIKCSYYNKVNQKKNRFYHSLKIF